jgi:hypothetical protein
MAAYDTSRLYRFGRTWVPDADDHSPEPAPGAPREADAQTAADGDVSVSRES